MLKGRCGALERRCIGQGGFETIRALELLVEQQSSRMKYSNYLWSYNRCRLKCRAFPFQRANQSEAAPDTKTLTLQIQQFYIHNNQSHLTQTCNRLVPFELASRYAAQSLPGSSDSVDGLKEIFVPQCEWISSANTVSRGC
jgi:hypothetical protein